MRPGLRGSAGCIDGHLPEAWQSVAVWTRDLSHCRWSPLAPRCKSRAAGLWWSGAEHRPTCFGKHGLNPEFMHGLAQHTEIVTQNFA